MHFALEHIIAEAESRQSQAGLHDAHSFVGYKLAARMARSLQEAATLSAGVQLAELLTELLQELNSRSLEGDSGSLVAAARSVTAELSELAAEAALRELVAG